MLWSCSWQGKDTQKCQADLDTWALQYHKKTDTHTCKRTDIPHAAPYYSKLILREQLLPLEVLHTSYIINLVSLIRFYHVYDPFYPSSSFLHYNFFILPLWPPSFHSLSWFPLSEAAEGCSLFSMSVFHSSSTFLYLFKVILFWLFYLLHNNLPSILPPVDLPMLWGYLDLFTTLPPSLLLQSFIHPSSSLIVHHRHSHSSMFIIRL